MKWLWDEKASRLAISIIESLLNRSKFLAMSILRLRM